MPKAPEPTRKIRPKPGPYKPRAGKPAPKTKGPKPVTSALPPAAKHRSNLTLNDWLEVYNFADKHPLLSQAQIVEHFANLKTGALIFTQATLSRKLAPEARKSLLARAQQCPNALLMKRARVVTRPDIKRMIVLWFRSMIERKEVVTGAMLHTKHRLFEDKMDVPQEQRPGPGWVQSFCRAYNIREFRRHGEAASVNLAAVKVEQCKLQKDMKGFVKRDRWNIDESALYPYATPDRGLADISIPGKKGNKFRITLVFACNADGSERREIMFIGKAHKPHCFKKKTGEQLGYYYRNNKKAWMTAELFNEWLCAFDLEMKQQKRKILLTLDNFSGHYVPYSPKNITLRFFEPNMTPFVQPLDAGVIRCFKAHFRKEICLHAVLRDDIGEKNIWEINQLEAMFLAKKAWSEVSQATIANCWIHTKIQPEDADASSSNHSDDVVDSEPPSNSSEKKSLMETGWEIILKFVESSMTLPDAEDALKKALGNKFKDDDWQPALALVTEFDPSEDDPTEFRDSLNLLKPYIPEDQSMKLTISASEIPANTKPMPSRSQAEGLINAEKDLLNSMKTLQSRKIIKNLLTIDEFVDHPEEEETPEASPYLFKGGDDEIVEMAKYQLAVEAGDIIEIEDEDSGTGSNEPELTSREIVDLCTQLERACIQQGSDEGIIELSHHLQSFRARVSTEMMKNAKQTSIDSYFPCK